jgi:hypothetical protein
VATNDALTGRVSLRIPRDRLAEIDRLWHEHGFPDRTAFMITAAVEYGGPRRSETEGRLDDLEDRVARTERRLELNGL